MSGSKGKMLMSDHVFYTARNKGNHRKITINTATLLVGKAPTKQKRIKLKVTMGLSTQKPTGTPEWIAAAHEFVARNHDVVQPKVDLRGFDIGFSTENLFHLHGIQTSKCQLRRFQILEMGELEAPDVMLTFFIYSPFSTTLWDWIGQMAGDEVWARFDQVETVQDEDEDVDEEQLPLDDEENAEEEEEEEEDVDKVVAIPARQ